VDIKLQLWCIAAHILQIGSPISSWGSLLSFVVSTNNRLYVGWFGTLLFLATLCFVCSFIFAPPVDIDGIREPVAGSLLYGNNIITGALIPSSNAIGVHFYPIWESLGFDEWLYNGGTYQFCIFHFFGGVCSYMGREWEFSFRVGMRPWIFIAFSAPVVAASAVFIVYPIGQGSSLVIESFFSNTSILWCINVHSFKPKVKWVYTLDHTDECFYPHTFGPDIFSGPDIFVAHFGPSAVFIE